MTIIDRYLMIRYLQVYGITFSALFGLYVVIDAFTNIDDFLDRDGGTVALLSLIGRHYLIRVSMFLNMIGSTIGLLAALTSFALVHRYGELSPILSAGVPTSRLLRPVLVGVMITNLLCSANEELILPQIATELQAGVGEHKQTTSDVEPAYDLKSRLHVSGRELVFRDQSLVKAMFTLSEQWSTDKPTIEAALARYVAPAGKQPGGWRLSGFSAPTDKLYEELGLTPEGRKHVLRSKSGEDLFVVTAVSIDRLYKRDQNFEFLATSELVRRIKNPSFGAGSLRRQSLFMHNRVLEPFLNLAAVLLGIPFVLRKESRSLIANLAVAASVTGSVFAINYGFQYLGAAAVLSPDLAAWSPLMIAAVAAAWVQYDMRS